jgi:23S rRNA pseudouridine955/2504/2580 synthase
VDLKTAADDDQRRLDRILRKALPELPLSLIHRFLRQGQVLVDGKPAKPQDRIPAGVTITIPEIIRNSVEKQADTGNEIILDILYEGSGLLILNKAPGIASQDPGSLEEAVRDYLAPKLPPSLSFRPGPLHRLDKPSSGIIVFSTNLEGAQHFSKLLRERMLKKYYLALVEGVMEKEQDWEDELVRDREAKKTFTEKRQPERLGRTPKPGESPGSAGGNPQKALTRVSPLKAASGHTLILAEILTGRTHQIRAQAAAHGYPLGGDKKYGGQALPGIPGPGGFLLHAWTLEFPPYEAALPALITAPLPKIFRDRIEALFGKEFVKKLID